MGYHQAGFDITGVDIKPMPRYPFRFEQADAIDVLTQLVTDGNPAGYKAIHASPPCQDHSCSRHFTKTRHGTGWMLPAIRELLQQASVPWVIENVPGAPMRVDYKLCGCMFGLRTDDGMLNRERWFETSWHGFDLRPPCHHDLPAISVVGHDVPSHQRKFGTSDVSVGQRRTLMGIDWMNRDELGQAIPPAYTRYIGERLMAAVTGQTVTA